MISMANIRLILPACLLAGLLAACRRESQPDNPKISMNPNPPATAPAHTNRLAREKSPYLLQHAHNPVDWFPWGEDAFAKARRENKPVFLSIGYSTCHWCHVMERESFEDEKVAAFLNEHFVSIKVDREERPDVDKIYMTFVQSTTGGGGWPMSVFLTPDLKPFFGGTYFPPDNRHGRPGFLQLLQQIAQLWAERKTEIVASAEELHARLELVTARDAKENIPLTPDVLRRALALFKDAYDPVNGGFGGAPKFPQPAIPSFVLRAAKRFTDTSATQMALSTCEKMAAGGIHDQLGGGFARYAVDAQWLVPHFEKMLYDNAQLVHLYLDAHLASEFEISNLKSDIFGDTARDILDYVLRDMTHAEGGFYSAEDADSEGHEGKFYCWTHDELSKLLTPEEFNVAAKCFGITKEGNFVDHSHPHPLPGQNVLSVVNAPVPAADASLLKSATDKMLAARAKRIRPHRDDKVLASWNGLMLGAFARAAVVLNEDKYRVAAEKNFRFILENLWDEKTKTLFHRWRDGERDQVQLLEGYAFMLDGVIQLYEATLDPKYLDFANSLAEAMTAKFHDPANGGFWQSPANANDLILRVKDDYDGAEPSGNSVAALALLKLAAITGRDDFRQPAEATLQWSAVRLNQQPAALAFMLQALDFWLDEPRRVVVAGNPGSKPFHDLLHAAHSVYRPDMIVLGNAGAVEPFAKTLTAKNEATVYICTGTSCQPPTSDPAKVRELLR
jgi:uncharacterized protein YyaL (SSP411 family)